MRLERRSGSVQDKLLSEEERTRIMAENEELGQAVTKASRVVARG